MENGLFQLPSDLKHVENVKNSVVSVMACFQEETNKVSKAKTENFTSETTPGADTNVERKPDVDINFEKKPDADSNVETKPDADNSGETQTCENEYSSESDALVIDESVIKKPAQKRRRFTQIKCNKKSPKETDLVPHSNPFFNASLYELSQQHQKLQVDVNIKDNGDVKISNHRLHKHKKEKSKSPKREYAQYLGLQPTVQFKCSKCGQAGFQTLMSLNNHILQCDEVSVREPISQESTSSSFKLKRKVFLCSACGTYYENWNLYLHMLELHRRFICLYCLGMFSAPTDLCHHIQMRHNLQPGHKNSLDEFFNVYNEPCYVVCCECNKLFNEEDNFFYHNCIKNGSSKNNQKLISKNKAPKLQIRPENHITGDSGTSLVYEEINKPKNVQSMENGVAKDTLVYTDFNGEASIQDEFNKEQLEPIENAVLDENAVSNSVTIGNFSVDENSLDSIEKQSDPVDSMEKQSDSENTVAVDISNNSFHNSLFDRKLDTCTDVSQNIPEDNKDSDISEFQIENKETTDYLNDFNTLYSDPKHVFGVKDENSSLSLEKYSNCMPENLESCVTSFNSKENTSDLSTLEHTNENNEDEEFVSLNQNHVNELESREEKCSDIENDETDHISRNALEKRFIDKINEDNTIEEYSNTEFNEDKENPTETTLDICSSEESEVNDTRRVPKLSLKLSKFNSYSDICADECADNSNDSERLRIQDYENEEYKVDNEENDIKVQQLQIAGPDVNIVELQLEQPLDKFDLKLLLQKCLIATAPCCIYCNHARRIAVNGKQLALHAIAEHRYSAIVNSITAEELIPETFVTRIKESIYELENAYFSLESSPNDEGVTFSHVFECFQCRYSTAVHKDLYLHNRKLHTKNLLLCIMCKSSFYSYSELICHLCPGVYILDFDIQFRCCMCISDNLPSAFRLMVHLRKRHHVCDVCLELCNTQYKLSNHVWKHKLHHFCYRCGIAYRNKPDITRHLFWKHGTESVLCKKCLQKKWPHVYHFCVPPPSFICDECNLMFTRAVSLKVHKRIHSNEKPHICTVDECKESFISKKLLLKHEYKHREPEPEKQPEEDLIIESHSKQDYIDEEPNVDSASIAVEVKIEEKPKVKLDVYDLPELNLSESDSDSDNENNVGLGNLNNLQENLNEKALDVSILHSIEERVDDSKNKVSINEPENTDFEVNTSEKFPPILENIWENFKNYQAEKEKIDNLFTDKIDENSVESSEKIEDPILTANIALADHDYCYTTEVKVDVNITEVKPDLSQRADHDYCTVENQAGDASPTKNDIQKDTAPEETQSNLKKRARSTSSGSSSDSDSSSCTCGSNCSCSSSSGTSSSSSDSSDSDTSVEGGGNKQKVRRNRKEKVKTKRNELSNKPEVTQQSRPPTVIETPIHESDLDTTESETDEEFYDEQPQKMSKKIFEEKRNQLLAEMGPVPNNIWLETSRPNTPTLVEETKLKKKSKSKKRKKHRSERKELESQPNVQENISQVSLYQCYQQSSANAPITLTISRNSPSSTLPLLTSQSLSCPKMSESVASKIDDFNLRASKRKRVPNKFYGYSSDEDGEKNPANSISKLRKIEPHQPVQVLPVVPPITIKTTQINPHPVIEPLTIKPATETGELRVLPKRFIGPIRIPPVQSTVLSSAAAATIKSHPEHSASDSNDSSSEEVNKPPDKPIQPQLYCYCRCPYDEVSEMIGCDANDCAIEWFHFECVGIMVPPKGQWFCPDCRKKKQRRESVQT